MSRRPYFTSTWRSGDSYVPTKDTYLPSPERSDRHDVARDRDRYFQRDSYNDRPSYNDRSYQRPSIKSDSSRSDEAASSVRNSSKTRIDSSTSLESPPLSKWQCDDLSKWSAQKHILVNNQLVDKEAVSLFSRPAVHAVYDPEIKKDESKGKSIIYKSHPKGAVPKSKDPRPHFLRSQSQTQPPKRFKKIPYKTLTIPRFSYDKNSLGPEPPTEILVSNLGNLWNEAYLRNQILSFGEMLEYDNVLDPSTGMLLGIIRVKFGGSVDRANRSVAKAVQELNNSHLEGRILHVIAKHDNKTLEHIKRKEINRRLAKQKSKEKKPAPPPAPKAHIDAIARREARIGKPYGKKDEVIPPAKPNSESTTRSFVVPDEIAKYVKDRPFLFINRKCLQGVVVKDDIKKHLNRYEWTRVLDEPTGIYVVFNLQADARRCLSAEDGKRARGVKLEMELHLPEDCVVLESKPEAVYTDPVEEATIQLTKEFENALQKDIRTKVIAPAVLDFLNIDNFPDLKTKIQPPAPLPKPVVKEEPSVKQEVSDDVFSLHRTYPKLPSFKKKTSALKDLDEKKRSKKLDNLPLNYKLNFEDEDEGSPSQTPDHVDISRRKKVKKMREPLLFSSSDEEDDEPVKESIPTTPEVPHEDKMEVDHTEDEEDLEMLARESSEDLTSVDKLYHPTATAVPIPVYDEDRLHSLVLDFEGLQAVLKDEEDFELMRSVLGDSITARPIKGSLEYWAWKQRDISAANKALTREILPESLESSTGSHRSEGYSKIPDAIKVEYLPHRKRVHDPLATIQVDNDDGESSKVQSSRVNRANNRRFAYEVSNFNTENEILKLNQLNKRKKPVSFARSAIHNWGLYALEPIAEKEMIIEYVGERIRQQVAEVRERAYMKSGVGSSYLFRVDADTVIDATKKGGIARFINHCCVPSCTAKIIKVEGQKRIVIYALRDIAANEELTYDYKFERDENDNERVRCLCGAPGCKGYLN